jgi:hypothetical protein
MAVRVITWMKAMLLLGHRDRFCYNYLQIRPDAKDEVCHDKVLDLCLTLD